MPSKSMNLVTKVEMKILLVSLLAFNAHRVMLPVHGLSVAAPKTNKQDFHQRTFRYVPYGEDAPKITSSDGKDTPVPTIACDGRVKGATLELTHWTGNETPDFLYADTSTEMALKFASATTTNDDDDDDDSSLSRKYKNAVVLNNHYDTDGVLSSWSCIQQLNNDWISKYKTLLIEGAEAGDFEEWSSDLGVKLNLCIEGICYEALSEEEAYEIVLEEGFLPNLLDDLLATGGEGYKHLWESGFDHALQGYKDIQEGRCVLRQGPGNIVILEEESGGARLSSYALFRGLREKNLWKGTTRILRVTKNEGTISPSYGYQYEKIGHGWVQKLVDRHMVPDADGDELSERINELSDNKTEWVSGGSGGLIAICKTQGSAPTSPMHPDEIASILSSIDDGA